MWLAPGEVRVQPHLLKQHPQSCFRAPRLLTGVTRRLVGPDVSRRKAARFRFRRVVEVWTNFIVSALSYHASGLQVAPPRGREGEVLNSQQLAMVQHVAKLVGSVVRLADSEAGCGSRFASGWRSSPIDKGAI